MRYLDRAKTALIDKPDPHQGRARRHRRRGRAVVERQLSRERAAVHQQHPAARRRHPSHRLAQRAHPPGGRLRRKLRALEEGEGRPFRRRHPRGPDLRPQHQMPGSEILLADQGQAGLLRGQAGRRGPGQRPHVAMVRGASAGGAGDRRQGGRGGAGARSGAQGARTHPPQGRARHREPARQARRLPGARSGKVGDFHRRGRFGRRHRQAGPQPRVPGGAAAARQDPQRRAGALRQDARQRADRHAHHRARRRDRARRLQPREAALPQDHHHDRRRRRRLAHPHPSAHLLLPPDAADHRGRASLHRPAAAVQGQARTIGAISQGRAGARGLSGRGGARRARRWRSPAAKCWPARTFARWSRRRARFAGSWTAFIPATTEAWSSRRRSPGL